MDRIDGRSEQELRKIKVRKGYLKTADGSCLFEMGNTKVLCAATLENKVPPFLRNSKKGWLTAEYSMLPCSSNQRIARESVRGKQSGRTHEIQRLIGRSLRAVVDLEKLGEKTIMIDCDVLQADGGTRTASITGAFIALAQLVERKMKSGDVPAGFLKDYVAAISVGIVDGVPLLDLCYHEDSTAEVDMNVVMVGRFKIIEVQGTAEGAPFSKKELDAMLLSAQKGIKALIQEQKRHASL